LNEGHRSGNQTPGDHYPGNPDPGSDLVEDEVRWNLGKEVTQEENSGSEAEYGGRETQVRVHRQRRKPDVHAVDEGNEVEQHHEGDDAQGDFAQHASFELGTHLGWGPRLICLAFDFRDRLSR